MLASVISFTNKTSQQEYKKQIIRSNSDRVSVNFLTLLMFERAERKLHPGQRGRRSRSRSSFLSLRWVLVVSLKEVEVT